MMMLEGGTTKQVRTSFCAGPTAASRSFAEELYKEREQQQLGPVFQVVGSLRNWTSQWPDDVYPTPRVSDSTRVMCWNAGGGAGTPKGKKTMDV